MSFFKIRGRSDHVSVWWRGRIYYLSSKVTLFLYKYDLNHTSISEHTCNFLIAVLTQLELLWSSCWKKTEIFGLTNLVSTGNPLHGRTGTASPDSAGPSQDAEEDSSTQSTEHLRHHTKRGARWEARCTQSCQDHLVSRCGITCPEVSGLSYKGSLCWGVTIPW